MIRRLPEISSSAPPRPRVRHDCLKDRLVARARLMDEAVDDVLALPLLVQGCHVLEKVNLEGVALDDGPPNGVLVSSVDLAMFVLDGGHREVDVVGEEGDKVVPAC